MIQFSDSDKSILPQANIKTIDRQQLNALSSSCLLVLSLYVERVIIHNFVTMIYIYLECYFAECIHLKW